MRTSNQKLSVASRAVLAVIAGVVVLTTLAGCGSAVATPPPTLQPTPSATPDPRLTEPASVDVVYRKLGAAGLRITPNTAGRGQGGEPLKRINATYRDWPLIISEFSSSVALLEYTKFDASQGPRRGDAPYRIVGLNILVEYGPQVTNGAAPVAADAPRKEAAISLVTLLYVLLGPLQQSSVEPLPLPGEAIQLRSEPSQPVGATESPPA
jgi:hypothetical protein